MQSSVFCFFLILTVFGRFSQILNNLVLIFSAVSSVQNDSGFAKLPTMILASAAGLVATVRCVILEKYKSWIFKFYLKSGNHQIEEFPVVCWQQKEDVDDLYANYFLFCF